MFPFFWSSVFVVKIPAVNIIDKAVAIVVNIVASNLAFIPPKIVFQVGMFEVDARINNGQSDA